MSFKIIWSNFAESQLDFIYKYKAANEGELFSNKLIAEIINAPNKLLNAPLIGQKEELLKQRAIDYRYLIYKNYKLIYSVDVENSLVKIADVFDTRQNPKKMNRGLAN